MIRIIPRDKIKHLEWKPGQTTAPITNEPVSQPNAQPQNVTFSDIPTESSIFSYDGIHKDFFQELITKANAIYSGTHVEIPTKKEGEVQGNLIKRMGLISTIAGDSHLKSANLYPITAIQSEHLLEKGELTNPKSNWEDFGMVLYDRSPRGYNPKEALALYDSLKAHKQDLALEDKDLEKRLIIINPGAELDQSMPHGVKPIIIPGITQVYAHEVLEKVGEDVNFEGYGLSGGLPLLSQLGEGSRKLYMPNETEDIGLRVLCRYRDLSLNAGNGNLAGSDESGRVNFAPQGALKK